MLSPAFKHLKASNLHWSPNRDGIAPTGDPPPTANETLDPLDPSDWTPDARAGTPGKRSGAKVRRTVHLRTAL